MIQTLSQYIFTYETILHAAQAFLTGYKERSSSLSDAMTSPASTKFDRIQSTPPMTVNTTQIPTSQSHTTTTPLPKSDRTPLQIRLDHREEAAAPP